MPEIYYTGFNLYSPLNTWIINILLLALYLDFTAVIFRKTNNDVKHPSMGYIIYAPPPFSNSHNKKYLA